MNRHGFLSTAKHNPKPNLDTQKYGKNSNIALI